MPVKVVSVSVLFIGSLLLAFETPAQPQPTLLVGAHYDVFRQAPIASAVYLAPIRPRLTLNGFLEVWTNNEKGYPASQGSVFSKHWLDYAFTDRLAGSLNLEIIYNRAGVDFTWPREMQFEPDEHRGPYVTPKLGFTYRIL